MEIVLGLAALVFAVAASVLGVMLLRARERAVHSAAQLTVAQQRLADLEIILTQADALRRELADAAKAAVAESGAVLSSKLIEDHRRETAEANKQAEDHFRKVSEPLVKQIDVIARAHGELSGQFQDKAKTVDTLVRSLSSPGGAGQIAQIGLGNTLKGMGLEAGRDYLLEASMTDEITGQRLRPDALVFLPGNVIIIIDCKSSKYLLEIAEAEGSPREAEAYANFAQTMNGHLNSLASKDYRSAVQTGWREARRNGDIARILSVMYLPSEAALEKLSRVDPSFFAKAREKQIFPAGPTGLHCTISLAAADITKERQIENQQQILDAARALLDGLGVVLGYARSVGKDLRDAAESFEKFTKSVNGRLLPRARRLAELGVPLPPGKSLPSNLPAYTVMSQETDQLIEGEAAEIADEAPPRLVAE
jgi:DNA recombination protein RmuC